MYPKEMEDRILINSSSSKAEGGLKAAALDVTAQAGTFTVWPADHEGQEYLKIHFQFTQGGASYPVMMMAVAETSPSVGRLVGFARDRTCGEFTFTADDTYFTGAVHADKIYVYYVDAQRILKSVGIWKMQDIGDTGAKHADFAKVLRHNAGRLGLAVE